MVAAIAKGQELLEVPTKMQARPEKEEIAD
jgi:hypothetical protein